MQVSEKMKKEVVELMKASKDSDLNKSYKFIDKLPLKKLSKSGWNITKKTKRRRKIESNTAKLLNN